MKKREQQRGQVLTRRALLIGAGQGLMVSALAARLYYLQILESEKYTTLAEENRVNLRLLAPPRGLIVDRFGVPLAVNQQMYRVVMIPEQAGEIEATLDAIGQLVQLTEADRRRVLREIKRKPKFMPIMVRSNLTWDEVARVEVNVPELPGVTIEEGLVRQYPYGETASHIIGYVAAVSEKDLQNGPVDPLLELPDFRIGKDGVEKFHDLRLRGKPGTSQVEVNAYGRVVRELARKEGTSGDEIVLTLDMALQDLAYRRCYAEKSASCVLLDAWTGDVLALVSSPGYDPSAFAAGITQSYWRELISNERAPLRNKAIAGQYAPGSTFKPVVALAAIEAGFGYDLSVSCGGVYYFGNTKFHCWKKGGHGRVGIRDAIKKSCDVWFYEAGRRLGIDKIASVANRFGLGLKHEFDVPGERAGIIPSKAWKLANRAERWHEGETISCSIGQSYVSTTPLQLATMTARLVTGRAVEPRITRARGLMTGTEADAAPNDFPGLNVPEKDLRAILDAMYAVVNEQGGTAYSARITDAAMAFGGKSGSSQVRRIAASERDARGGFSKKVHEIPWKERDHALFVSYAPAHAPRYVCAVVVEHGGETTGGGSAVAAPICRDVLREAQKRDPARRIPPGEAVAGVTPVEGKS
jgi:penicillin-binding protein 2